MAGKHVMGQQIQRLKNAGSIGGVIRKLKRKRKQGQALRLYGTAGFPSGEKRREQSETVFARMVKISILVPLYNTPKEFLVEMIESVVNQTYSNWQLCLADGSDDEHGYVGEMCIKYGAEESRIVYKKLDKNEGISGNTNRCYKLATGDFIGLFDHDDVLHPELLYEYVKAINEYNADFLYCDEATFSGDSINNMITAHFKPDFAIDNLRANNYICHFSCFKKELLDGMELFRPEYDGSQDYDMILRVTEKAEKIVHVPRILYYWRSHSGSTASNIYVKEYAIDAAKRAISGHLERCGFEGASICSTDEYPTHYKVQYKVTGKPPISIIACKNVESSISNTSYNNYEIINIENNSPTAMNDAVRVATGEYLLFLNVKCEAITPDWIEQLLMYAQRADVGAVGAKLLFDDGYINNSGIIIGLGQNRVAGKIFYKEPGTALGYMGKLTYAQNLSAVSGDCMMVSRSRFDEVDGFDEHYKACLTDIDFCLKLREKGYVNVFTPFAKLYKHEQKNKGFEAIDDKADGFLEDLEFFKDKWGQVIETGDPYYNLNFSLDYSDCRIKIAEE